MKARCLIHFGGLAPIAIIGLLITACGSATPSGGGGSQPTSGGSGSGGTGTGSSVNDGIGHPVNICSLLPVATVASVSAEPVTVAQEDDTVSYKSYVCNYTSADGTSVVNVTVGADDAVAGYANSVSAAGSGVKQITGLGDKAFSSVLGVEALFGNVAITVAGLQSDDAAVSLIKDLQPKL